MRLAAKGSISSGNGAILLDEFHILDKYKIKPDESILISGEILFNTLFSKGTMRKTDQILKKYNFTEINCLLFIRNPMEHASSFYQQLIKREGYTASIETFFNSYKTPEVVCSFVEQVHKLPTYSINVVNYSNVKANINKAVTDWLQIPESSLTPPILPTVNRSLTYSELTLQKFLNVHLGKSGRILSDRLCEKLPNIKSEKLLPDIETQKQLWERLMPAIEKVNSYVDSKHHYTKDLRNAFIDQSQSSLEFSLEQMKEIAAGFSEEIKRLNDRY
jgi:hypothetical protein